MPYSPVHPVHLLMPDPLFRSLKAAAQRSEETVSAFIRRVISETLAKNTKAQPDNSDQAL